ncbi:unnamed protein product, partial [Hapterophycus canaliculatus]
EQRVARNQLAYDLLAEATLGAIFFETIEASRTVLEAWHAIVSWISPSSEAEVELMRRQLDNLVNYDGEDPKMFFLRVDKLLNELRFVDEGRSDRDILNLILRNLSDDYSVEKKSVLTAVNITRQEVQREVRESYANRKAKEL